MKIVIIGAGMTGLSLAYILSEKKHSVIVLEAEKEPGGMAATFKRRGWKNFLEKGYHHWFTNDKHILKLAKELGVPFYTRTPRIDILTNSRTYRFDSPSSVLKFSTLKMIDRIRLGVVTIYLKILDDYKSLESTTAINWLYKYLGRVATDMIWTPVLAKKFGNNYKKVGMSWFWARVKKRTFSLAYPKKGFYGFTKKLSREIVKKGGSLIFKSPVTKVETIRKTGKIMVTCGSNKYIADKVVFTTPSPIFLKVAPKIPVNYENKLIRIKHLHAQMLVLVLKKKLLGDTYWLNVNDMDIPFLVVVEHTNFIKPYFYNKEHIVYVGNYLPHGHPFLSYSKEQLSQKFFPYLDNISKGFRKNLIDSYLFTIPYAQPIIGRNYKPASIKTPLKNIYLANMDMIYPWDRGTNYAVELGEKAANIIIRDGIRESVR